MAPPTRTVNRKRISTASTTSNRSTRSATASARSSNASIAKDSSSQTLPARPLAVEKKPTRTKGADEATKHAKSTGNQDGDDVEMKDVADASVNDVEMKRVSEARVKETPRNSGGVNPVKMSAGQRQMVLDNLQLESMSLSFLFPLCLYQTILVHH